MSCSPSVEKDKEIIKALLKLDPVKYKNFDRVAEFILNAPIDDESKSVSLHTISHMFIQLNQKNNSFELGKASSVAEMGTLLTDTAQHLSAVNQLVKSKKNVVTGLQQLINDFVDVMDEDLSIKSFDDYDAQIFKPFQIFFTNYKFNTEAEKANAISQVKAVITKLADASPLKTWIIRRADEFIADFNRKTAFIPLSDQLTTDEKLNTFLVTLKTKEVVEAVKDASGFYYNVLTGMPISESDIDNYRKSIKVASYQRESEASDDKISHVFYDNDFVSGLTIRPYSTTENYNDVVSYFDGVSDPVKEVKIFAVKLNDFTDDRINTINNIPGLENKKHETFESLSQSEYLASDPNGEVMVVAREKKSENNFTLVGEVELASGLKKNFYIYTLDNYVLLDSDNTTTKLDFTNNSHLQKVQELAILKKGGNSVNLSEYDLQTFKVLANKFKEFKNKVLPLLEVTSDVAVDVSQSFYDTYTIDKDFKIKSLETLREAKESGSNIFQDVEVVTVDDDGKVLTQVTKQLPFIFTKDFTGALGFNAVDFLKREEYVLHNGEPYSYDEYLKEIGITENVVNELIKDINSSYVNCVYVIKDKTGKLSFRIGKYMEHLSNEVLFTKFVADMAGYINDTKNLTRNFDKFFEQYSFKSRKSNAGAYTLNINFAVSPVGELQLEFRPVKFKPDYDFILDEKQQYNFTLGKTVMQDILKTIVPTSAEYTELQNKYLFLREIPLYTTEGLNYDQVPVFINSLYENNMSTSSPVIERVLENIRKAQDTFNNNIYENVIDTVENNPEAYEDFLKKVEDDFGGLENLLFNKYDNKLLMPRVKFGEKQVINVSNKIEKGDLNVTFNNYGVVNSNNKRLQISTTDNVRPSSTMAATINEAAPINNNTPTPVTVLTEEDITIPVAGPLATLPIPNKAFEPEDPENLEDMDDVPFATLDASSNAAMASQEDIYAEHNWFTSTYADTFPIEDLDNLKDLIRLTKLEGSVLGAVKDKVIYLNKNLRTKGVLYHESFHAVFRYLMEEPMRRNLLDNIISNKKYSSSFTESAKKEFAQDRNLVEDDNRITDLIAEEILADGFQAYMNKKQEPKTLIQKFFEFLKNLIAFFNKHSKFIDEQYGKIRKGDFTSQVKESEVFNNEIAFLSIRGLLKVTTDPKTGKTKTVKTELTSKQKNELIDSVVFELLNDKSDKSFDERFAQATLNALSVWDFDAYYNQITDPDKAAAFKKEFYEKWTNFRFVLGGRMHGLAVYDINDTNDPKNDNKTYKNTYKFSTNSETVDNFQGQASYALLRDEVERKYGHMKNFIDDYEDFSDDESKDLERLKEFLDSTYHNPQNDNQDEQDENVKNPYDDKSLAEKGGLESLPKELRQAFSIIRYQYEDAKYGITIPKHVDGYGMFGVLLKISSGVDVDNVVDNIKIYSDQLREDNVHIAEAEDLLQIYNYIKEKCGIIEDNGFISIKNNQFYNMFIDTVVKASVDYIMYSANFKIYDPTTDDDNYDAGGAPVNTKKSSSMTRFDIRDKILSEDVNRKKSLLIRDMISTYNNKKNTSEYITALTAIRKFAKKYSVDTNLQILSPVVNNDAEVDKMAKELSDNFQLIGLKFPKSLIRLSIIGIDIAENNNTPKLKRGGDVQQHYMVNERFINEGKYLQKDFFKDIISLIDELGAGRISGTALSEKMDDSEGLYSRLGIIIRNASSYITTYDPTELPSVFRNAEGKPVYRYLPYTPVLHIAEEVRQGGLESSLRNDPFFNNSFEYYSVNPYFKDIFANKNSELARQMKLYFSNFNISLYGGVEQTVDDEKRDSNVFKNLDDTSQHILGLLSFLKRTTHTGKISSKDTSIETFTRMFTTIESTNTNYLMPAYYEQYADKDGLVTTKDGFLAPVARFTAKIEQEYERIRAEYTRVKILKKEFDADKRLGNYKLLNKYNAILDGDKANVTDSSLRAFNFSYFPEFWNNGNDDLKQRIIDNAKANKPFNTIGDDTLQELKEGLQNFAQSELNQYLEDLVRRDIIKPHPDRAGEFVSTILPRVVKKDNSSTSLVALYGDKNKYNIGNVVSDYFFNFWVNSLFFNEIFDGDIALGVKNATDYNKRQKRNAAANSNFKKGVHKVSYGNTIKAYIHPEYLGFGPYFTLDEVKSDTRLIANPEIREILIRDYGKKVTVNNIQVESIHDLFDGQSVSLLMHHADMYDSIGRLNDKVMDLIIKKHYTTLTAKELKYLQKNKVVLNSKKTVTASRSLYHKLSEVYIDRNDVSIAILPTERILQGWTGEEMRNHLHKLYTELYNIRKTNNELLKRNDSSMLAETEEKVKAIVTEIHKYFMPLPHREKLHDLLNSMEYHNIDQFMDTTASKLATLLPTNLTYKDESGYIMLERSAIFAPNKYKFWQVETSGIKSMIKYSVQSKALLPANLKDITTILDKNGVNMSEAERASITEEMNNLLYNYHTTLKDVALAHEALMNTFFTNEDLESNVGFMFDLIRKNLSEQGVTTNKLKLFETDATTGKPIHSPNLPEIRDMLEYYFFSQYSKFTDEKGTGAKYIHMSAYGYDVLQDKDGKTVFTEDYRKNPFDEKYEGITSRPLGISVEKKGDKTVYYIECILPKPLYDNRDLLKKYEDKILKMFGVRIPTEDKRSMVALRVVDYIDSANMSGIIVPQVVHILAGSDLDVDTLYTQQYSFYRNYNGATVLYGDYSNYSDNTTGEYIEYLNYLSEDKDVKPIIKAYIQNIKQGTTLESNSQVLDILTELNFDPSKYNLAEAFSYIKNNNLTDIDIDSINDDIRELDESSGEMYSTTLQHLLATRADYYMQLNNIKYVNTYIKILATLKALSDFKLPATKTKFKSSNASSLVKNKFQNIHLDAKLDILSNNKVFNNLYINERSSTQMFMEILNDFGIKLESNDDPFTITGVINARTKNVLSKLGIGVTANNNKTLAFLSQYFDDELTGNLNEVVWKFRSDVNQDTANNFDKLASFNVDDTRTIAIIGNILGMFADGVKEPIPAALHLNEINTNITLTMLGLGMDPRFALAYNFIPEIVNAIESVQQSMYAVSDGVSNTRSYLITELNSQMFNLSRNPKDPSDKYHFMNELKDAGLVSKKSSIFNMSIIKDNLIIKYDKKKLDPTRFRDNKLSLMDLGITVSSRETIKNEDTGGYEYTEVSLSENAQKLILLQLYKEQSEQSSKIMSAGNIVNMFKNMRPDFDFLDKMRKDVRALKSGTSIITDDVANRIFENNQVWPVIDRILEHADEKSKMFIERSEVFKPIKDTFEYLFKNKKLFAKTVTAYVALNKYKNTFIQNDPVYSSLSPAIKEIKDAESVMMTEMFRADYWFNNNLEEELTEMQEKHPDNIFLNRLRSFTTSNSAMTTTEVEYKEKVITLIGGDKITGSLLQDMEDDANNLFVTEPLFFKRLFIHELVRTGLKYRKGSFYTFISPDFKRDLSKYVDEFVDVLKKSSTPDITEQNLMEYLNVTTPDEVYNFMRDMLANLVYTSSAEVDNNKILKPTSDTRKINVSDKDDLIMKMDFSSIVDPQYDVVSEVFNHILPLDGSYSIISDKLSLDNNSKYLVFNFNIPDKSYGNLSKFNMIDVAKAFGFEYHDKLGSFIFPAAININGDFYLLQGVDAKIDQPIGKNLLNVTIIDKDRDFVTDYNTGKLAFYQKIPKAPTSSSLSTAALDLNQLQRYSDLTAALSTQFLDERVKVYRNLSKDNLKKLHDIINNKTLSENKDSVVSNIIYGDMEELRKLHNEGTALYTMRVSKKQTGSTQYGFKSLSDTQHFGNPFTGSEKEGLVSMKNISAAVDAYEQWLDGQDKFIDKNGNKHDLTEQSPRRDWILAQIEHLAQQPEMVKLGYFKAGYKSHADVINEKIISLRKAKGLETESKEAIEIQSAIIVQQELQSRYDELVEAKKLIADTTEMIVVNNLPKLTPESAKKETGTNTGTNQDISPALLSNDGVTVEQAAHDIWEDNFVDTGVDTQDVRNIIIDILLSGKQNYIKALTRQDEIDELKRQLATPKTEANTEFNIGDYTNHSGGAVGADSAWDNIGKQYGMVNNKHYWTDAQTPKGNTEISKEDFEEGRYESAKAAQRNFGYQYATMKDSRLIRNWSQVKYSDAIFAIGTIVDKGEPLFPKLKADTRVALTPSVTGGTGYAVGMAINHNQPTYVFNQTSSTKYSTGWYTWDSTANDFIKTETPILTKDFAGIGTREINDLGKQAIKEVYENTLNLKITPQKKAQPKAAKPEVKKVEVKKPKKNLSYEQEQLSLFTPEAIVEKPTIIEKADVATDDVVNPGEDEVGMFKSKFKFGQKKNLPDIPETDENCK